MLLELIFNVLLNNIPDAQSGLDPIYYKSSCFIFQLLPVNNCVADRSDNHAADKADDGDKVEWVCHGK